MQLQQTDISESQKASVDGLSVAKAVKYWLHLQNPYSAREIPLSQIQAKSLYNEHKVTFDNASAIFSKYGIDPFKYSKFFICQFGKHAKDIDASYLSPQTFNFYVESLQAAEQKRKVFKNFMKTANFIADQCIDLGYPSSKEWIRNAISERKLASYYVAGKVSKHFLASIPNFPKILPKLDQLSRDELSVIAERFDLYNTEINEAFLFVKKCKLNPIDFVDTLIVSKCNP